MFAELLRRIENAIEKQPSRWRQPLSAGLKFAVTLRYLASGDSYKSLMYSFRVSDSAISIFIPEVCQALVNELADEVVDTPVWANDWLAIEEKFRKRWNVPHALGALDGKHVRIKCPAQGGSIYYNYKEFHSIILLALVDSEYRFRWVDLGENGSCSDCTVFNHSDLKLCIEDQYIDFPADDPLPGDTEDMPYFILGDDAFALRTWLMKPVPGKLLTREQKIYNYRISRGRRVVENAFGIMASRFRCLQTALPQKVINVKQIVMACVVLHNFIRLNHPGLDNRLLDAEEHNGDVIPGAWWAAFNWEDVRNVRGANVDAKNAKKQRLTLQNYFNGQQGSVPWQDRMI